MEIWPAKYQPTKLNDLVLDDDLKSMFREYLNKETISNLLLHGRQGIGKTTLAKVIVRELDATDLYINASAENGIDVVRNKITDFSQAVGLGGSLKIVILDEADGLTPAALHSLRNVIEECADDTRFIFTSRINRRNNYMVTHIKVFYGFSKILNDTSNFMPNDQRRFKWNKTTI